MKIIMVTRVRATNKQKRYSRNASPSTYAKMTAAATAVVLANRGMQYRTDNPEYVLFSFPFWVTFAKGFPKGHVVDKTLLLNVHKINAVKLLNWLHEQGHCSYNSKQLVAGTKQFEVLDKSIDKLFNIDIEGE